MKTLSYLFITLCISTLSAQKLTGTWNSTFGELRLVQEGNEVFGDYKNVGSIYGKIAGNELTGKFTNGNTKGNFIWIINSNKTFTGKWAYNQNTPNGIWNGTLINIEKPKLTSSYALLMPQKLKNETGLGLKKPTKTNTVYKIDKVKPVKMKLKTRWKDYTYRLKSDNKSNGQITITKNKPNHLLNKKNITAQPEKETSQKICVTEIINFDINSDKFRSFAIDGVDSHIFPGNIFKLSKLQNGNYNDQVIAVTDRLPVDLTIESELKHIESPSNALLKTTTSRVLSSLPPKGSSMVAVMKSVETKEDMAFELSGNYSSKSQGIAVNMGMSASKNHGSNYFMIDVTQSLYSATIYPSNKNYVKPNIDASKYALIKSVNYGRRAIVFIKTNYTKKQLKTKLGAKYSQLGETANINAALDYLKNDKSLDMRVFFYGGRPDKQIDVLVNGIKNGSKNFQELLEGIQTGLKETAQYVLPIGYKIIALDGDPLYMKSSFNREKTTCIDKPSAVEFAITFSEFYIPIGRDGKNNPDDLVLSEKLYFKLNSKTIAPSKAIQRFPSNKSQMNNPTIFSNWKHQLHLQGCSTGNCPKQPINNSFVYKIEGEDIDSPYMELRINHWLKEYTKGKDWQIAHWDTSFHQIPIREILNALITNSDKPQISKQGHLTFNKVQTSNKPIYNGIFTLNYQGRKYQYKYTIELFK